MINVKMTCSWGWTVPSAQTMQQAMMLILCLMVSVFILRSKLHITHFDHSTMYLRNNMYGKEGNQMLHCGVEMEWNKSKKLRRSHTYSGNPVMYRVGLFLAIPHGVSHALFFSYLFPQENLLYRSHTVCTKKTTTLCSSLQTLQNYISCPEPCVYYICKYVCETVLKRVKCFTLVAAKTGRQREPRPQRGCKWD